MTFRQSVLLLLTAASVALLASCSSSAGIGVAFVPPPPASMSAGSQINLSVITNDSAGVTWSSSCSNPGQCGSFTGLALKSATFQAPVAIPSTLTVTATSVTDTSRSKTATIAITQATTLNDGTYVYQLSGEDANGPFYVSGAFTVAAGAITGGEQDFVDPSFKAFDAIATDSTIAGGATDSNLQIILDTGDDSIGVDSNGLETINLTQTSPAGGLLTWFDAFAAGSGRLDTQNAAAALVLPASGYALLTSGFNSDLCAIAVGAVIDVDGPGTISGDGSLLDANNCGSGTAGRGQTVSGTVVGPTGTPTVPDPFGRVVFTLNPSITASTALAGYIVSSSQIDLAETADTLDATTGGIAYAQASADVGNFSSTNLSTFSYAIGAVGEDPAYLLNFSGSLTFNADGSVSGTATFNDTFPTNYSGTIAAPAGSYTVDPTGDVTVTGLVLTDTASENTYTFNLQFYLDGNGNAVSASMDVTDVTAGPAYQQTSGATIAGAYALGAGGYEPVVGVEWSAVGPITVSSAGAVAGFTDFNYPTVSDTANVALSGTITEGSGTITGLGAVSATTSDTFNFYVIDSNRAFGIETDDTQLGLTFSVFQN